MDNLKSLIDNKQYDLVIEMTEKSYDATSLIYRVIALFANNNAEAALSVIDNNRFIINYNPAAIMKIHIEILCFLGKFDLARKELDYYKDYPYSSQNFEELLHRLPDYISAEERRVNSVKFLSKEELKKLLKSDKREDVVIALDTLKERNVNEYMAEIQNILLNFPFQTVRSLALIFLVHMEYSKLVSFNQLGNVIEVNPSQLTPPFVGKAFNKFLYDFETRSKNSTISQTAVEIFSTYVVYVYPEQINFEEKELSFGLYYVTAHFLKVEDLPSLEEYAIQNELNIDKLKKNIQTLEDSLLDF